VAGCWFVGAQRWMSFIGYYVLRVVTSPSWKESQRAAGESAGSNSREQLGGMLSFHACMHVLLCLVA
jgi:hypothetical protein